MTATAVLLIPGFFGFSAFGSVEHPILEYFAGVQAVLQPLLPGHFIVAHEPPPTGSLASRAGSLYDAVEKLLKGELLPHGRHPFKADRVHLVGHSTGGVDARLFANPAFPLDRTMTPEQRRDPIGKLGNIVTLSAPFHGTPIADNIKEDNEQLLEAIRVLTMLGVFSHGDLVRIGLELAKFSPCALLRHPFALPKAIVTGLSPRGLLNSLGPLLLRKDGDFPGAPAVLIDTAQAGRAPSASQLVATEVSKFFRSVENDRALLPDLTERSMSRRNGPLPSTDYGANDAAGGGQICSYVTVAPPPHRFPLLDLEAIVELQVLQRYIYATLYRATADADLPQPVPAGPSVPPGVPDATGLLGDPAANDGVVPARSQTLEGKAKGIIVGDHLDVVGSYDGGSGANIMRSGSNFTGDRFEALWNDIARWLQ
jgi:triacylglycerol lipase